MAGCQCHPHRPNKTLAITIDGETRLMTENQSAYVPVGARHRLANPGRVPARVIEIQSGTYIGDDDIVRYSGETPDAT